MLDVFLRSLNDKVGMNEMSLMHSDESTEIESFKILAEKLYSMLNR
jgi:hypothetical protein